MHLELSCGCGFAQPSLQTTLCRRELLAGGCGLLMMRAYALGQGAGTQVILFLPWTLLLGRPEALTRDLLMSLAWVINLALAEWLIGKPAAKPATAHS